MKPTNGIVVDGYCTGNPGPGGYKGVDLETGEILFKSPEYPFVTNNLVEYIAIVHAMMYIKKNFTDHSIIYSDSEVAIGWLKKGKISSGIDMKKGEVILDKLGRCTRWLSEQKRTTDVKQWITKEWGENPADFGNK